MLLAILFCLTLLIGTITAHFIALRRVHLPFAKEPNLKNFLLILLSMIGLHSTYVGLYAAAYGLGLDAGIGEFDKLAPVGAADLFIHSAVNFTTLGLGTIVPSGPMRLIAAVEASNGFIVTSMSASAFFTATKNAAR